MKRFTSQTDMLNNIDNPDVNKHINQIVNTTGMGDTSNFPKFLLLEEIDNILSIPHEHFYTRIFGIFTVAKSSSENFCNWEYVDYYGDDSENPDCVTITYVGNDDKVLIIPIKEKWIHPHLKEIITQYHEDILAELDVDAFVKAFNIEDFDNHQ